MKEISSVFLTESEHSTSQCPQRPHHVEDVSCNECVLQKVGLAQAMVPMQPYETPSTPEQSLVCGTAFSALSMPYKSGTHIMWNRKGEGK